MNMLSCFLPACRLSIEVSKALVGPLPETEPGAFPQLKELVLYHGFRAPRVNNEPSYLEPPPPTPAGEHAWYPLPASWSKALPRLRTLTFYSLTLGGSLPNAWMQPGALPALENL